MGTFRYYIAHLWTEVVTVPSSILELCHLIPSPVLLPGRDQARERTMKTNLRSGWSRSSWPCFLLGTRFFLWLKWDLWAPFMYLSMAHTLDTSLWETENLLKRSDSSEILTSVQSSLVRAVFSLSTQARYPRFSSPYSTLHFPGIWPLYTYLCCSLFYGSLCHYINIVNCYKTRQNHWKMS